MERTMQNSLKKLIGHVPNGSGITKRMRIHQGWWRTFVLLEPEGEHPSRKDETVCNTISNGKASGKNFLSPGVLQAVNEARDQRTHGSKGLIEKKRLFNNLLSSQPLCFNFFGEIAIDHDLALGVIQQFYPQVTEVKDVLFEFAPASGSTDDNSAFDVALEVQAEEKSGLIGLECKYTDSFSQKQWDKPAYRQIFEKSERFTGSYEDYIVRRFNQLFRNQLIAEGMLSRGDYDFVKTGLFCYHQDESAIHIAREFQRMLRDGEEAFQIITYRDFIAAMQKLDLTWEQRELSMRLWARYCGLCLSEEISEAF